MLQLRARGFALRDQFADALRGVITREEAMDTPDETAPPAPRAPVQLTSEPVQQWPMFGPDGVERSAKNARQWSQWCKAAIDKLPTAEEVVSWRTEMQPHFETLEAIDAAAVEQVQGFASDRLDVLADEGAEA
ncbi:hypothetical protein MHZ93_04030 [Roseomonas sp. ACRSG]|nr:hypothetical protein [Roseomonas sp. ACRSG]